MKTAFFMLFVLLTGSVWGQSYEEKAAASKALIGKPLQAHSFYTLDKKPISFESLQGEPVVAYFFASWCAPCYKALNNLDHAIKTTPSSVQVIAISLDEDWESLEQMLIKTGFSGVVWKSGDAKSALAQRLFANFSGTLPHIIRIDKQGMLIEGGSRIKTIKQWEAVISQRASLSEASTI